MIFIWGTKGISSLIKEGYVNCPVCNTTTKYELKVIRRWFTIFWIPVIPLRKKVCYLECQSCLTAFNPAFFENIGHNVD